MPEDNMPEDNAPEENLVAAARPGRAAVIGGGVIGG